MCVTSEVGTAYPSGAPEYPRLWDKSNRMVVTSEVGTAYPSEAPEYPRFFVVQSLVSFFFMTF